MSAKIIFHIAKKSDWQNAQFLGLYTVDSLGTEGFIHCSLQNQVVRVANFLFKGQSDLVLLKIESSLIKAEIKYEGETDEKFPHIYGPINLDAVLEVFDFAPEASGLFKLPFTD